MAKFTEILNRLFVSKNWILRFVQPIPVTIMGSMAVDRASCGVHRPPSTPLTPDPVRVRAPTQDARYIPGHSGVAQPGHGLHVGRACAGCTEGTRAVILSPVRAKSVGGALRNPGSKLGLSETLSKHSPRLRARPSGRRLYTPGYRI